MKRITLEEMNPALLKALKKFNKASTKDGTTVTLRMTGMEDVVITPESATRACNRIDAILEKNKVKK